MSFDDVLWDTEQGLWHYLAKADRFDEPREWATFVVVHAMRAWMDNTSLAPEFADAILAAASNDDAAYADAIAALTADGESSYTEGIFSKMNEPHNRSYLRAIGRVILALDATIVPLLSELDPIFEHASTK